MALLQIPPIMYLNGIDIASAANTVKQNTTLVTTTATPSPDAIQGPSLPPDGTSFGSYSTPTPTISSGSFTNNGINYSIAKGVQVYVPAPPTTPEVIESSFINSADSFTIGQFDENGEIKRTFKFSLLPAIESSINGRQVPEVKPGILKRSSTNIKTFTLPGGVPAFQVLGLNTSILQLVGLFIGAEDLQEETPTIVFNNSKNLSALYTVNSKLDATRLSEYFEEQFVQTGRPVSINISTNNSNNRQLQFDPTMVLTYKALLQDVRYFIARQDRVYYSLDAVILDYPLIKTFRQPSTSFGDNPIPQDISVINDINVFNRDDEETTSSTGQADAVLYPAQGENGAGADQLTPPEGYELKEYVVRWQHSTKPISRTERQYFYVKKGTELTPEQIQIKADELYGSEMIKKYN